MKPLISVCALRIWKIKSCLRIPVAPATFKSLATCVSFWMLMSFRSLILSVGAGLGLGGASVAAAAGAAAGGAAAAGASAACDAGVSEVVVSAAGGSAG